MLTTGMDMGEVMAEVMTDVKSSGGKQNPATNGLYLRELDDDIQSEFEIVKESKEG